MVDKTEEELEREYQEHNRKEVSETIKRLRKWCSSPEGREFVEEEFWKEYVN